MARVAVGSETQPKKPLWKGFCTSASAAVVCFGADMCLGLPRTSRLGLG